jgi:hypothetical protein
MARLAKFLCLQCGVTTFANSMITECQHCGGTMKPANEGSDAPSALRNIRDKISSSDEQIKKEANQLQEELEEWLKQQN